MGEGNAVPLWEIRIPEHSSGGCKGLPEHPSGTRRVMLSQGGSCLVEGGGGWDWVRLASAGSAKPGVGGGGDKRSVCN